MPRRRPVPREWRDENHWLDVWSHRRYGIQRAAGAGSNRQRDRAGGTCSCGVGFGTKANPPRHNMNGPDVRDAWRDHVEEAYHGAE